MEWRCVILSRTFTYYAAFITFGLVVASLGPTLPGLAEQTGVPIAQISFLFAARSGGYLTGSILGGRVYDRLPGHPMLAGVLLLMALALFGVPLMGQIVLLVGVLFIVGISEGMLDVGGNTMLVWNHPVGLGPYMNGLHFCFGIGAFIAPLIVAQVLLYTGEIAWNYWIIAFTLVPVAIALMVIRGPEIQKPPPVTSQNGGNPMLFVALVSACFFVFVGAEVGIGGWIYTYAMTLGLADETVSAYLTSAFWGSFTLGRLVAIPIAARFLPRTIVFVDIFGTIGSVLLMMAFPNSATIVWIGAIGSGLFIASMFASLFTFAERRVAITGRVSGWFFAGASLGAMTVPWLIGQLFEPFGAPVTMVVVLIDLLVALALFVALLIYARRFALRETPEEASPVPEPAS